MHTTSVSLLERLRHRGEREAWGRFVDLYTPLLFHWCRQAGLQEADAVDVVQDTFGTLLEVLPDFRYQPGRSFRGWLWTIARNKCRELQRRQKVRVAGPIPFGVEDDATDPAVAADRVDYLGHVLRKTLEWMREEFPSPTWELCWEHVVEDRTAVDVAVRFGVSLNVVYLAKSRVLKRLRVELAGLLED